MAMVELLIDSGIGITYNGVEAAKQRKLTKVVKWMTHKKPEPKPTIMSVADVMNMAHDMAREQLSTYKEKK